MIIEKGTLKGFISLRARTKFWVDYKFKKMWAKSRTSKIGRDAEKLSWIQKSFNINEEYQSALRTHSYAEFFAKAQQLAADPCATPRSSLNAANMLLEPQQRTVPSILESVILPESLKDLKLLILGYFDTSAQASRMCSNLLRSINEAHSNYHFIQRALEKFANCSPDDVALAISELDSFTLSDNPFTNPYQHEFKLINERYSRLLRDVKLKRNKVARRVKLMNFFKKASGICLSVACGVIALVAVGIAVHSLSGLLMGPTLIFTISPFKLKKRLSNLKFFRSRFLRRLGRQLDAVEKGTYILNRDFDTVSRLVARLHDEVEHNKAMARFWLERRRDKLQVHEVVKELNKCGRGLQRQIDELEEHVCLCLVTINRARILVINEISAS